MGDPTGEADRSGLRLDFDRRLMLQFCGSAITSGAGLLPYANWMTRGASPTKVPIAPPTHAPAGMAGIGWSACCASRYSDGWPATRDVKDADRLCRDPAMRWVVGDLAIEGTGRLCQPDGPLSRRSG
jgi:hypothetical protein